MPRDSHRWSAKDIIEEYPKLGIPHFQRGLVWGEESVSLLLESLYFQTPCGELVLWRPRYPKKEGIPLGKEGVPLESSAPPHYLIVDGQQRIRSVWGALTSTSNAVDLDMENGTETDGHEIWCLNLNRVPKLQQILKVDDGFPLFRLIRHPLDPKARYKYNVVPLSCFFEDQDVKPFIRVEQQSDDVFARIDELRPRVKQLRTQRAFSVTKLVERDGQHTLPDVVALYNRINSGGIRVEPEERAFATLVSMKPQTSTWLGEVFKEIDGAGDSIDRDSILKRKKERNFGFKLFIRTFVQVCAYHFGYSVGSNLFSFDVLNGMTFRQNLADPKNNAKVQQLFNQTKQILHYVRETLDKLNCDDLRMLPETMSLLPVFQVLIRYPDLMDDEVASTIICSMVLRLLLLPMQTQRDTLKLVLIINSSQTAQECFAKLYHDLVRGDDFDNLAERLPSSRSLQDRYVLMLYWLVRRKGARDFSYRNLTEEKPTQMLRRYNPEATIDHRVEPQKQHIVPYSMLRVIYGITGKGRLVYHPINDIGNLTYISAALNDYETGLGADPVRLEYEPRANLEGHFLAGEDADNLRRSYQSVVAPDENDATRQITYEKFCAARRELIAHGFADWLSEETPSWFLDRRITPIRRQFYSSDDDLIRGLKYPPELEDAFLAHVEKLRYRYIKSQDGKQPTLAINVRDGSGVAVLELKLLKNRIEISAKKPVGTEYVSRLAAGSLKTISEGQWHLRVDSKQPTAAASVLSTLLDEVLSAKS